MKDPQRGDAQPLDDMLDALRYIREHLAVDLESFARNPDLQKIVAYDLMILGGAANHVSQRTQKSNPAVPWAELVSLRNELLHESFALEIEKTWKFARQRSPAVEHRIRRVRVRPPGDGALRPDPRAGAGPG